MTTQERAEIIRLCRIAGCAPARIAEIESGCDTQRVRQIVAGQLDACIPGTLVLSDPTAASHALDIALAAD